MARKRRPSASGFNISFLDIMSCGLGAVVLLFLIIKHSEVTASSSEATRLVHDVAQRQVQLETLEAQLQDVESSVKSQETANAGVKTRIAELSGQVASLRAANENLSSRIAKDRTAQQATQTRMDRQKAADAVKIEGRGERRYLTGMEVTGHRIVLMLDRSASMVDETIVDILRRRATGGHVVSGAPKWQRALRTMQWLTNRLPSTSKVQIVSFSDTPTVHGKGWIEASDTAALTIALDAALNSTPAKGTNLTKAFAVVARMSPVADSIYVVTDGLPTLGAKASSANTVSGRKRLTLFSEAVARLPSPAPTVNTILLPLEGDPVAAYAYWKLAYETGGIVLSPAKDWP